MRSSSQVENLRTKTDLSCPDLSQDSKNVICYYVRQLKMPKKSFKKVALPLSGRYFDYCTAKTKGIASKFYMCIVCMWFYNM